MRSVMVVQQPTVLRIWDCLMLEGPKILFRVALGVIFYFESQLAKMHSLEQVMGSLKAKLALLVRLHIPHTDSFQIAHNCLRDKDTSYSIAIEALIVLLQGAGNYGCPQHGHARAYHYILMILPMLLLRLSRAGRTQRIVATLLPQTAELP